MKPVQQASHATRVCVDPRVELISIVQHLSRYREVFPFLLNGQMFAYREAASRHFADYADHPVVRLFDEVSLLPRMFNFMAPPTTMLYLQSDLSLRDDVALPEAVSARIGGPENLETFARLLQAFCAETGFADFYEMQRGHYESLVAAIVTQLGAKDYVRELEGFYGMRHSSYTLIPVSLYGHVGFGPHVDTLEGDRHIYNIFGPQGIQGDTPSFGDARYFAEMQRHEFSHSFVNPLTDRFRDQVEAYSHRYATLAPQKVCGEWSECVNEYIIRAVTTHLAFQDDEESGQMALDTERGRGVVLIDELLARVRTYAANRERYPTFVDCYPYLFEAFTGAGGALGGA
jgi:hypothetical protein